MSGTLFSLAQSPIARRDFPVAPEPVVAGPTMGRADPNMAPLDTTDPTALMMLRAGIGQTVPQTSRLYELAADAAQFSGGIRAYHGGPGSVDWAAPNTRRGAIDEWRATPDNPTFFAASPARASEYAVARYPDRAAVYPVELDQSSMLSWNQADSWRSNNDLAQMAKEQGARVVEMRNAYDGISDGAALARVEELLGRKPAAGPETIYMVLDPSAISTASGR